MHYAGRIRFMKKLLRTHLLLISNLIKKRETNSYQENPQSENTASKRRDEQIAYNVSCKLIKNDIKQKRKSLHEHLYRVLCF